MLLRSLFSSLSRSQLPFSPSLFLRRSIAGPTSPWIFPSCRQPARFGSVVRASSAATGGDSPRPPDPPIVPPTPSKVLLLPLNHDLGHSFHACIPLYDLQKLDHNRSICLCVGWTDEIDNRALQQAETVNGIEAALGSTFSSDPLSPPSSPLILVISGPSGVGKDAVIKVICHICCIC